MNTTIKSLAIQTINRMKGVWYLIDDDVDKGNHGAEDADANGRRFRVSRRDVKDFILSQLHDGIDFEEMWDYLSDDAASCEVDERFYAPTADGAY